MYKNIIVGFDDSESSRHALSEVAHRVKGDGSHIKLVHAVYHDSDEFDVSRGQLDERLTVGQKVCTKTAEEFNAELGVNIETIVCEGAPEDVLVSIADSTKADMIAMGTRGKRGIKKLLMGSVTAGVIEKSPCDVLVVNKACQGCSGDYKHILVAYDGSEHSNKALAKALALGGGGNEVTVLYVIPRYQEMIGFFKSDSVKNAMFEEAGKILEEAKKSAGGNGQALGTVIQEGHAAEKIAEMAQKLNSELVVMGSHGWTGVDKAIMGSTTERVIVTAPCPVLVVR